MKYRTVFNLAWPVILSNLTIPLLGSIDIAMMGHTGSETLLASVAIGAMLFDFLFWGFGFLRMSTTGLTSQSPKDKNICLRGLVLASLFGLTVLLAQKGIFESALYFLDTSPKIDLVLSQYFHIRIFGAIPTLCNYVILGYLFGQQNTKGALHLVIITNLSAVCLDILMVYYLMLGIKGLAMASVLAQTLGMTYGLFKLHRLYGIFNPIEDPLFNTTAFKRLLSINRDIFLRTFCLLITFAVFTREGAKLGPVVVSANAILLNMQQIMGYALDGFTIACETLVGSAYGERNKAVFIKSIKACSGFCLIGAFCFSLTFFFLGDDIIALMSSLPLVQQKAHALLPWIMVLPLLSVGSFVLDGVFIGATWTKEMRNSMLISSIIFLVSCYTFLPFKAHGLWFAFCLFMLSRFILLLERLYHKLSGL